MFAAVLWLAATFYFFGDTGKHSDDYWVAMRSMVTGAVDWSRHPWVRWPYFWRPLHLGHCSAINTISWNHPWIGHLELAIVHGACAWMLAGLIARLGVRRGIAWAIGVLFMACPLNAEAALWSSASCNAISSLFLLRTLELVRRQGVGGSVWARDAWIGVMSLATACWYEPAAAALGAVPLVFFAAGERGRARSARWWGVARCTAAAGIGCAAYEALLVWTAPKYVRGGASSFVSVESALSRAGLVLRQAMDATAGSRGAEVIAGSIEQGWDVLAHSVFGVAVLALLAFLAMVMIARSAKPTPEQTEKPQAAAAQPPRVVLLVCAGLAIYLCAWLPIIAIDGQRVELRTLYVPMLGVAIAAAAVAEWIAGRLDHGTARVSKGVRATMIGVVALAGIAGAIGMIGFQAQFRGNAAIDRRTVEQLRDLMPTPPQNTIFLPLVLEARGAATGRERYDHAIHGAFETPYCCAAIVQWVFHRADTLGAPTPWWMRDLTTESFRGLGGAPPIPWERCVPFVVSPDGKVRLVRKMTIDPGDTEAMILEFPRVPETGTGAHPRMIRLREVGHAHCQAEFEPGESSRP